MNNSKQKNIIYGNDYKKVLPYSSKDDECLDFTQNSNITDFGINNVFQQLINNDLFIENQMQVDSQYGIGPLMISSETQLSALPDGTKAWSNTEDVTLPLQIVKKTEIPLSSCFDLSASHSVYFIVPVGDSVFIGTSEGLFVDGVGGLSECLDNNNHKIIAYSYHVTPEHSFFATRSSIYRLDIGFNDGKYVYNFNELSSLNETLSSICGIAFDEASNTMYVASAGENSQNSTLAYSVSGDTGFSDWNFHVRFSSEVYSQGETYRGYISSDIAVNSMTGLKKTNYSTRSVSDNDRILAATNKGVFRSYPRQYIKTEHVSTIDGELISMASFSDCLYALFRLNESSYKLYKCSGGTTDMQELSPEGIILGSGKLKVCGDNLYLTQPNGIYTIDSSGTAVLEYSDSENDITNMDSAVIGNRPYIFIINENQSDGKQLCYYINESDSDFHLDAYSLSDIDVNETVEEIAIGQGCGEWNNTIYIRTVSNEQAQKVYAYFIKFSPGASFDYSQIFGFDQVPDVSDCRKIIVGGDVCYYAYGSKISNGVKEIDIGSRINDIFYVGDASPYIIAAAQGGVYKIDTGLNSKDLIDDDEYAHIADTSNMLCFSNAERIGYIDKKDVKADVGISSMSMQGVKDIIGSGNDLYMLGETTTNVSRMTEYEHGDVIEKNASPSCWHIFELEAPADADGNSAILGLGVQGEEIDTESSHGSQLYSLSVDDNGNWSKTVVECGDFGNTYPIHAAHSMNNTVFLARNNSISRFELPYNDQGYVDLSSLSQSNGWSNYSLSSNVKSIINTTLSSQSDPAVYISINDKVLKYQTGEYALNNEILSNYTGIPPLSRMLAWKEEQDSSLSNIIVGIISAEPKLHILRQKITNSGPTGQPISATVEFSDLSAAGSGLSTFQLVLSWQQTSAYNIEKELSTKLGGELSDWTGEQISDAILTGPISVWLSSVISSKFPQQTCNVSAIYGDNPQDYPPICGRWLTADGEQSWCYTNINGWRYNSISKSGNHVIADFSYQLSAQRWRNASISNYQQKDITPYDIIYDGNTKIYMLYTATSVNCTSVWYEQNPDNIADRGQMKYSYETEIHQYVTYFDYDEIMGFNGRKSYQISSYRDCGVIQEHDIRAKAKVLADEYDDRKSLFVIHCGDELSVATFEYDDSLDLNTLSRIGHYNYSFDLYKSDIGTWYIAAFKKNGTTLSIDLYQCNESGNPSKKKTLILNNFNLDKSSTDIFIKDISINDNDNSINSVNVLVCDYEHDKLYSCFVFDAVDFNGQPREKLDLADVRRFSGSNNIKGFKENVVKNMTTSQRYLFDKQLNAVYSVDKTFVQADDNMIYSIGGYADMQFYDVQLSGSNNSLVQNAGEDFKLHRVQSDIYLTVWRSSEQAYDIYKLQPDSGDFKWFSKIPNINSKLIFISVFKQNVNGIKQFLAVSRKSVNDPVLLWNIKEGDVSQKNCEFDQITSATGISYRSVDVKYSQYSNRLKEIIKRASQALGDYYAPFWFSVSPQKEIFLNFQQLNQRIFNELTLISANTRICRFENEPFKGKKYGVSIYDSGVSLLEIPALSSLHDESGASDLFTTDNRKFYVDETDMYYQENAESVYVQLPMPFETTKLSCIKRVPDECWYMTDQDGNLYKSVSVEYYPSQISAYGTVSCNGSQIENAIRIVGNSQFTGVVAGNGTSSDMLLFTPEYVESTGSLSVQVSPLQCRGYENPGEYPVSIFQTHGDFSKAIAYTNKDNVYLLNIQAEFGRANADKITHSQVNDYLSSCQQVLQCGSNPHWYYLRSGENDIVFFDITPINGIVMKPVNKRMYGNSVSARSFCQIGENEFLVNTDNGLYRYAHTGGLPTVAAVTVSSYNIGSVALYNFGGGLSGYLFSDGSTVYESSNYRVWKPKFQLSCGDITAIYPKNTHDWYIGSTSGLYMSSYKYKVDVDISKISEQDIYNIYKDLISCEISSAVADLLSGHEEDDSRRYGHTGDAIVNLLNDNIVSVDFSGLSVGEWPATRYDDEERLSGANNDLVLEQYWGDAGALDSVLSVYTENCFVSADCADAEYFIRRWKSGVTEMYVHVPTTNTYYVNHLPSTPGYSIRPSDMLTAMNVLDFGSSKAVFDHDPNKAYTKLRLSIDKRFVQIDYVIGVYANGNSLPLRIYKDTNSNPDVEPAQFFNSYVAPTVYIGRTDDEESGRYIFDFACFGADEQAIKMLFIEKNKGE